jgi:hypothetical protein
MGTYYKQVEQYLDRIDTGAWVEIGVDRGEGSTKFFADLAEKRGVKFYGVDADHEQIARANSTMSTAGALPAHVNLVAAKGEDFLLNWRTNTPGEKISLAYLDNFDWDYWLGQQEESFVPIQKQHYRDTMKVEMLNLNSQLTHLTQTIRMLPLMADNSIIVCDDTWYHPNEGIFIGKCSAVIPLLLVSGYSMLHHSGYRQNSGAILGRFK